MKKQELRLNFCKGDAIVIVFVIIFAIVAGVLFWQKINSSEADIAMIYKEGKKIRELPLEENAEILVTNVYTNKIEIQDGKAAITESDCPGKDCVHSGWITGTGRSIVCLPNRVEIRIEGNSEVDFIVH